MVGDNIRKHPDEYRMVVEHGHRIGNHTFNHIRDLNILIRITSQTPESRRIIHSDLFRPPHGHMGFGSIIPCAIITALSCGIS
jgi:peptidoglycan/xylan/chitin deacetylase (PgdA/CDA1 family)